MPIFIKPILKRRGKKTVVEVGRGLSVRDEVVGWACAGAVVLSLVGCTGAPPGAYEPQEAARPAAPAPADASNTSTTNTINLSDPNRIVCRTEPQTGSRLGGERTCLTARRWAEIDQAEHKKTEDIQGKGSTVVPGTRS